MRHLSRDHDALTYENAPTHHSPLNAATDAMYEHTAPSIVATPQIDDKQHFRLITRTVYLTRTEKYHVTAHGFTDFTESRRLSL